MIDFRRYWWIFRSDALSHRQYKGAQVTTISRLRKREGRQQEAVPVLVPFEPALVLPGWSYCQQPHTTMVLLFLFKHTKKDSR